MQEAQAIRLFKCLADKSRLQILKSLMQEDMYVERLAERLSLSPATISFHLKKLEEAGAVSARKEQYYTMYAIRREIFMTRILDVIGEESSEASQQAKRDAEYREKILKKRLAYSTISQISYILLGLSFLSEGGLRGGLLHLMSHMAAKGCLFMVAGIFIVQLGIRRVDDLKGIGKRMPASMWCFALASLSLVGIPPFGGFLSKWVIASAAIDSGIRYYAVIAPAVLLISALLTAGYLLTTVVDGFFPGHDIHAEVLTKAEPPRIMWIPLTVLCGVSLVMGLFGPVILSSFGF